MTAISTHDLRDDEERHGIGGNAPPAPLTALEVTRYLTDTQAQALRRRDELLAGVVRFREAHPSIEDAETQGRAGDFAKQLQAALRISRDLHALAKKPFTDGGRAVDQFFRSITDPLDRGLADVHAPMNAFALRLEAEERARRQAEAAAARAEAERVRRELREQHEREQALAREQQAAEAARRQPAAEATVEDAIAAAQQADAAERAAAARAADLTRTRGDAGSVNSLRETWEVEVLDLALVPVEFLMFNEAAARRAVAGGKRREIPGCRVTVRKHVQTR